jgi:NADH:ubiquinone oxidoreductase subunit 5 (subunit L)/multisubunit Na+/H+ antiporter MnhA subunit
MAIGIGFAVAHPRAEFEAPGFITPLAITVAVAGIVLAWLTYQRGVVDPRKLSGAFALIRDAAIRRYWLDDLFAGLYRGVILGFSRVVGWIDRYLVDGVLNVLSALTLRAGDRLRGIQTGLPQDYVYGVALGVLLLFVLAQWGLR